MQISLYFGYFVFIDLKVDEKGRKHDKDIFGKTQNENIFTIE